MQGHAEGRAGVATPCQGQVTAAGQQAAGLRADDGDLHLAGGGGEGGKRRAVGAGLASAVSVGVSTQTFALGGRKEGRKCFV